MVLISCFLKDHFVKCACCNSSGHFEDLSSSEDSDSAPPRVRPSRSRAKGASIHDGPQAIAKFRVGGTSKLHGGSHETSALLSCGLAEHLEPAHLLVVIQLYIQKIFFRCRNDGSAC